MLDRGVSNGCGWPKGTIEDLGRDKLCGGYNLGEGHPDQGRLDELLDRKSTRRWLQ